MKPEEIIGTINRKGKETNFRLTGKILFLQSLNFKIAS